MDQQAGWGWAICILLCSALQQLRALVYKEKRAYSANYVAAQALGSGEPPDLASSKTEQ